MVLGCLGMLTYPHPKIINTPGLSLNRSSLLVRARQRGIKPEVDTIILVRIKTQMLLHTHICAHSPVQMYVLYREP